VDKRDESEKDREKDVCMCEVDSRETKREKGLFKSEETRGGNTGPYHELLVSDG